MSEKVYTGILSGESLQEIVEQYRPQAAYSIVESLTDIAFLLPQEEPVSVDYWPKGRLFSPDFELRWEQVEGVYRTILTVADDHFSPPESLEDGGELPSPERAEYYCWREHDPRLGRALNYRCIPGQGEVKLIVHEYRDNYGRLIFWRYVAMKREGDS